MDDGQGRLAFHGPGIFTKAFLRHYVALGIPPERRPKACHGFRAAYATHLRNVLGGDVITIKNLMGHSDPSMTERYFAETGKQEKALVERLEFPGGGGTMLGQSRKRIGKTASKAIFPD